MLIIFSLFLSLLILIAIANLIFFVHDSINVILCDGAKKHIANHPGITEKTLFGQKDIICPKCKCPQCTYVLVSEKDFEYPTKFIIYKSDSITNQFKQLLHKIRNSFILDFYVEEKYKCMDCGYIF